MDKKIKNNWLADLRSDNYPQGFGGLMKQEDDIITYCCLGVLCITMGKKDDLDFEQTVVIAPSGCIKTHLKYLDCSESGLTHKQQQTLIELNDESEQNFHQIADFIENTL